MVILLILFAILIKGDQKKTKQLNDLVKEDKRKSTELVGERYDTIQRQISQAKP